MSINPMINKINTWRKELEKQGANMGIRSVFDSMCVYIGEQQREIEQLKREKEDK
ncbi:hypothetical protein ACU3L3_07060 [Priestia endophytica]